jgi:hypothetical protein
MSYVEQWNAIAARIRSLGRVAELYAQFMIVRNEDGFSVGRALVDQSRSILDTLKNFRQSFHATLPPDAKACLDRFINERENVIRSEDWRVGNDVKIGPVLLTAFEVEMSFLLSDTQEVIRARSERAFLHLQRLLAVDADFSDKWRAAFEEGGERHCEKLGAVHLLWHGIFAFKIAALGAGTDLVFPDEPIEASLAQRGIEGLVLTEWKVADEGNAASRFQEARNQAQLYQQGPLVSSELTGYRYAIAVSLTNLAREAVPDDMVIGGVVYRHINIAIGPKDPSVQARAK